MINYIRLEETRNGMSNSHMGKHHSEETRLKISNGRKGKQHTEETRQKISNSNRGYKYSDEIVLRRSEAQKGKNNNMYGKHHIEETKLKISIGNKGKHGEVRTEETKRLMRVSAIKRIKDNRLGGGQLTPSYNPKSIPIIEEYGKANGYNFQHAENGGEFYIKTLGYWVDGYDKTQNVVIEYYEKAHRNSVNRDERRK